MIAQFELRQSVASRQEFSACLLKRGFGIRESEAYIVQQDAIGFPGNTNWASLIHGSDVSHFYLSLIRQIETNVPDFVTFSTSLVDQLSWERAGRATVISGDNDRHCTAHLFALVRSFVGKIVTGQLMGTSFLDAYSDDVVDDLSDFSSKFSSFVVGIPRWVPDYGLPKAYNCRRKLLRHLTFFHNAFAAGSDGRDPGFEWRELDDVSQFMQSRLRAQIQSGVSVASTASVNLALLLAINTKLSTMIFWNLVHILENEYVCEKVMQEIAAYAKASRSCTPGFDMLESPSLLVDMNGLLDKCPMFKASYYETLRLHSTELSFWRLQSDIMLTESASDASAAKDISCTYSFKKGDYIGVSQGLINSDPIIFEDPSEFDPDRFLGKNIIGTERRANSLNVGNLETSYHRDQNTGHDLEMGVIMAFTASLLALWDIQPVKETWNIPKSKVAWLVNEPRSDIKVQIRCKV